MVIWFLTIMLLYQLWLAELDIMIWRGNYLKKVYFCFFFCSSNRTEKHIHDPNVKILEQNIDEIKYIWLDHTISEKRMVKGLKHA